MPTACNRRTMPRRSTRRIRASTTSAHVSSSSCAHAPLQESVPVVCGAIHGSQDWKLGNFTPASVAWSEPLRFDGLPRGGRGYREASELIGQEIHRLWEWLVDIHAAGRPRNAVPPRAPAELRAPVTLP